MTETPKACELKPLITQRLFDAIGRAKCLLIGIGQPLNDNVLRFNKEQLMWAFRMEEAIDEIRRTADRRSS